MTDNLDFFKIKHNDTKPEKGFVLVSEPFLQDTFFKRSVVLITEHSKEGTVGFILNNPIKSLVSEILSDFPDIDSLVGIGGPVQTDIIHYLHTAGDLVPDSVHVKEDLYSGGDFEVIRRLINEKLIEPNEIRFFVGFSSWHEGQLERELSEDSWMVTSLDRDSIMNVGGPVLWEQVLKKEGKQYQMWPKYPKNPLMN